MKRRDPLKIAFGSATPVFMDDKFTIKEYMFHVRLGGVKRRMCFRYDCATKSIISHTPIERPVNVDQREKLLQYFRVFVGKRKKKEFTHVH
jgi:hypothetical protein